MGGIRAGYLQQSVNIFNIQTGKIKVIKCNSSADWQPFSLRTKMYNYLFFDKLIVTTLTIKL
jgi:hypothetical protein